MCSTGYMTLGCTFDDHPAHLIPVDAVRRCCRRLGYSTEPAAYPRDWVQVILHYIQMWLVRVPGDGVRTVWLQKQNIFSVGQRVWTASARWATPSAAQVPRLHCRELIVVIIVLCVEREGTIGMCRGKYTILSVENTELCNRIIYGYPANSRESIKILGTHGVVWDGANRP